MTTILIQGAQLYCADRAETQGVLDILIEDGVIAKMGRGLSTQHIDEVVDAQGLVGMPGLVQAHTHLCQTLFRGQADDVELLSWLQQGIWPMEAALDAVSLRAAAELGIGELLLGGTTSILDMGTVHHTDVLFETARNMGIRYTGGKTIMDSGQGYSQVLKQTSAQALADSQALCQRWHQQAQGRLRYAFSPRFVLTCSEATLQGCAQLARQYGARLHTHACENSEEIGLVHKRHGCSNIEYLQKMGFVGPDVVLAHGVWLSPHEQQILRQSKTHIAHCPSSNLKLASGIARIDALLQQEISVALGADGAPCNNNLDGFLEMRLSALLHKVRSGPTAVNAAQALHMATRAGALALGLEDCGQLVPGAQADIVLLDLNRPHTWPPVSNLASRIVYAAKSSDVHSVWVQGKRLVKNHRLQHVSMPHLLKRTQKAWGQLRRKMGLAEPASSLQS